MLPKKSRLSAIILILVFICGLMAPLAVPSGAWAQAPYDNLAIQALRNNYSLFKSGQPVNGAWGNFSSYDACILDQAGADVQNWVYDGNSFGSGVIVLIDATLANEATASKASSKRAAQDYLAAKTLGEAEKAAQLLDILQARQVAAGNGSFDNNAFSDIPALELLGRAGDIDQIDTSGAITYLLGDQDADGAWTASGFWQDIMTTCEAVRALKYLQPYAGGQAAALSDAIDQGCTWLAARQQNNGSFQDDFEWDDPAVDTAEIIYTLELLAIDPAGWQTGGHSAQDYMQNLAMNEDKTFGSGRNIASNTWVLDAYLQLGAEISAGTALGLSLDPASVSLAVDGTRQLSAACFSLGGDSTDVSPAAAWSVDNPAIAGVLNGLVTGLQTGQTTVHGVYEELTAAASVSVHGSSGETPAESISVNVSVVGRGGTTLFASAPVTLSSGGSYGYSPLAALNATGLSWSLSPGYDDFVTEIAGQSNQGTNGWMYKVNGLAPMISAGDYTLSQGDSVIWWYSTSASDLTGVLTPITTANNSAVIQTITSYRADLDKLMGACMLANTDKRMPAADVSALKAELDKNMVQVAVETGTGETLITDALQEVALLVPEKALTVGKTLSVQEVSTGASRQTFTAEPASPVYHFGPDGTRFEKPVTISLKVAISEDTDVNTLTPAWFDEQSLQWVPIPGVIDLANGLVVFEADHFTDFALISLPPRTHFDDVDGSVAWAQDAIEILAGKGIISGTGQGFEPQKPISRAEFVHLLVKALGLSKESGTAAGFSDVNNSEWYASDVYTAYRHKIIAGYPDGTFRPQEQISRNEAVAILNRLSKDSSKLSEIALSYKDAAEIPVWALDGAKLANKFGLMKTDGDDSFDGYSALTRAGGAFTVFQYLNCPTAR